MGKVFFNLQGIWDHRGLTADSEAKETGEMELRKGEILSQQI